MQKKTDSYSCKICKDRELVYNKELDAMQFCKCREKNLYERILKNSGISEAFREKTFANFEAISQSSVFAKQKAMEFALNFDKNKNSIAFLGQVGSGKTHLSIAIANNFMSKNIGVLYMQYRETITVLKQNMLDEEYYQNQISRYKNAKVLLIDDLFKGKINETDINIMFEIINYRYLKKAPIIVSTEFTISKLLDFDEAIGSRIIEMCRGSIVEIKGSDLNYRLKTS